MARLDIFEERYEFIVAWDNDGYPGLALGEEYDDDPEHVAANAAAASLGTHARRIDVMVWDTKSDAMKALRAARAAVKAVKSGKPMPPWAVTATAEGWKPPKGWKP